MKTPRDILFARHKDAAPKLDAIRSDVVRKLNNKETKEQRSGTNFVAWLLGCSNKLWLELVWPSRRIWAGLAAVWLVILAANISMHDNSPAIAGKFAPTPEMIMAWRQQNQLLTELIGPNEVRAVVPPKPNSPQPRTEGRIEVLML
jgi:hypothetical protein